MISDAHRIYELSMKELGYKFSEEQVEANVRRLIGVPTSLILVAEAVTKWSALSMPSITNPYMLRP
jgi:hypothetical protein